jgi:mycothiol system anti-sigma-R factor
MTCQETIARLSEYLDAELTPETLRELEAHLAECAPCRAYLATYRKTRELAAKVNRVELPEDLKARIRAVMKGGRT